MADIVYLHDNNIHSLTDGKTTNFTVKPKFNWDEI
jgi:hypothetical protein